MPNAASAQSKVALRWRMSEMGTSTSRAPDSSDNNYPIVRCPRCKLAMFLVGAEQATANQTKLKYSCVECGTEAEGYTVLS